MERSRQEFGSHEPGRARPRRAWIAVGLCALLLVSGTGAAWGFDRTRSAVLPAGTVVGGVAVGGLTEQEATDRVHRAVVPPLQVPVLLRAGEVQRSVSPWELGLRVDGPGAVRAAFDGYRSAPLPRRLWDSLTGNGGRVDAPPQLDREVLRRALADLAAEVDRQPQEARLDVSGGWVQVVGAQDGQRLELDAAVDVVSRSLGPGAAPIDLPVSTVAPAVPTDRYRSVVLVRRAERRLYHYVDGQVARTYPVAVGKLGHSTPSGVFEITAKRRNPAWYNPGSEWARGMPRVIAPGPANPLGTRALNINSPGIRIHGTAAAASIGQAASHGCIRMLRADVEELFERVETGDAVVIV
ncbi:MAG TPA: L,D-transpeptidase/peptidoglycan binding protein [Actinomycetota bacterium]|nr:L,D-transpeptidase/peptidoglycan binding protein [Actinomycetota bacterium]